VADFDAIPSIAGIGKRAAKLRNTESKLPVCPPDLPGRPPASWHWPERGERLDLAINRRAPIAVLLLLEAGSVVPDDDKSHWPG